MQKKLFVIGIVVLLLAVGLSGCEELNNDGNSSAEIIRIEGMDTVQTVNYLEKPVKLIVDGMNCVITVTKETNLKEVIINGMDSIVRVSRSHSFSSTINGMDAEIVYYD